MDAGTDPRQQGAQPIAQQAGAVPGAMGTGMTGAGMPGGMVMGAQPMQQDQGMGMGMGMDTGMGQMAGGQAPTTRHTRHGPSDRIADLDMNDYSRAMYGVAFTELTAPQKQDVAAAMRSDERSAAGIVVPGSEADTATTIADRAARAAHREATRHVDDYAQATYGANFEDLTPEEKEDVANYMRREEKRAFGAVIPGGEAATAKRMADAEMRAAVTAD